MKRSSLLTQTAASSRQGISLLEVILSTAIFLGALTAIMQITRVAAGNPCSQTHEVFDGKMRFRLTLSSKGRRRIPSRCKRLFIVGNRFFETFTQTWLQLFLRHIPEAIAASHC